MRFSFTDRIRKIELPETAKHILNFVLFALIIGLGIFFLLLATGVVNPYRGWVEVTAKIVYIDRGNSTTYVNYIFNSKLYENVRFSTYSSTQAVGDLVQGLVNPNSPTTIASATDNKPAMIVIGSILVVTGVLLVFFKTIRMVKLKGLKATQGEEEQPKVEKEPSMFQGYDPSHTSFDEEEAKLNAIPVFDEEKVQTYYFTSKRHSKPLFVMFDEFKSQVCEARKTKFVFGSGNKYLFKNFQSQKEEEHVAGISVSSVSNYCPTNSFTPYFYYFDYIRVWDYLEHKGMCIRFDTKSFEFTVYYNDTRIGTITRSKEALSLDNFYKPHTKVDVFEIKCYEKYIDRLFLAAFTICYGRFDSMYASNLHRFGKFGNF